MLGVGYILQYLAIWAKLGSLTLAYIITTCAIWHNFGYLKYFWLITLFWLITCYYAVLHLTMPLDKKISDRAEVAAEWKAAQSYRDSCRTIAHWRPVDRQQTLMTSRQQQHMPPDCHRQRTLDKPDHSTEQNQYLLSPNNDEYIWVTAAQLCIIHNYHTIDVYQPIHCLQTGWYNLAMAIILSDGPL